MAKAKTTAAATTKSTYTVTRQLHHDGDFYAVGDSVDLSDFDAGHLVLGKHVVPSATPVVIVETTE